MKPNPVIRPASAPDLLGLMSVRPDEPMHRERLARQHDGEWLYLAAADSASAMTGQILYGFALLIWAGDEYHLNCPVLADIFVREPFRGQGIGTRLIERAEWLCRERGLSCLGLSVNPTDNPRALALYAHLGYQPTGDAPHCVTTAVTDEQGRFRLHEDWRIAMAKELGQEI